MAPIRGLNLKKLFGTLTPYVDDVARGVSNYGDDALRLASNYGDEALDYGVDIASAVNRYDDDVARAFNSDVGIMDVTPKKHYATDMGLPPPIEKPLFEGDVRMNADGSFSILSADDVYNIENDWLTQDMLSRGELDNVGSLFPTRPISQNDLRKAGYGKLDQYGMLHPDIDASIASEYNALQNFEDPYEFLKNPAALNWGGSDGEYNLFEIDNYLRSIGMFPSESDLLRERTLFNFLKKHDAAGSPNHRNDILETLFQDLYMY